MRIGFAGLLAGVLVAGIVIENSSPGSTAPAAEHTRDATSNWMVTIGGAVSDAIHVAVPVAADGVETLRAEFPNFLGPPADGGGTAQHPPAQP